MNNPVKDRKVWDLSIRLFHWVLLLLVVLLWISGEFGGLDLSLKLPVIGDVYLSNMDVHALAGQAIFILVIYRILWGLWGSTTARFSFFMKRPATVLRALTELVRGGISKTVGHNPLGGVMVAVLLLLLGAQSLTGMFSADDLFYEGPLTHLVSDEAVEIATGFHNRIFAILQILIVIHILAVFYYLIRRQNLIKSMVTGRKSLQTEGELYFPPWWLALVSLLLAVGVLLILRSL